MISLKNILSEIRIVTYGKVINGNRYIYLPSIHSWYSEYSGDILPDKGKDKNNHTEPELNKKISPYDSKWINTYKKLDKDDKEAVTRNVKAYKYLFPDSILKFIK